MYVLVMGHVYHQLNQERMGIHKLIRMTLYHNVLILQLMANAILRYISAIQEQILKEQYLQVQE